MNTHRAFLTAVKTMLWDPDFKDFAGWESVSPVFQNDFKDWLKLKGETTWILPNLPWEMYRHEYITDLLEREIQNEFEEEKATPARVETESGSQQGT